MQYLWIQYFIHRLFFSVRPGELKKSGTSGFGQDWGNLNVVGPEACNMQRS